MGTKPSANDSSHTRVLVLGGGLSGLSAACHLLDYGYQVTLVEKRPFLGGRAFSFKDEESGLEVDNGQHVFMGCCNYYIGFLKKIGSYDSVFLQESLRLKVTGKDRTTRLSSLKWLGNLHMLPSLLMYKHLSMRERLLALYALLRIKFINRTTNAKDLNCQNFYQWLKKHHQTDRAINNLWNLIVLPMLNEDVHTADALMAVMVFQEGLLKSFREATIGFSKIGLTSLAGEPAAKYIKGNGGSLVLGKSVTSIVFGQGSVQGVELSDGTQIDADFYVSALSFDALTQLLPPTVAQNAFFSKANGLSFAPIVGVHIWYDRPVMEEEMAAFVDSPVQFVFNKNGLQGENRGPGQYVCISLSGAWEYLEMSKSEVSDLFIREMESLFPKAKEATVERLLVVKQPQATFRSIPGASEHRLTQRTPVSNLFVAGEWTDTGWPSTMEGAVRSGVMAAEALRSGNSR